MNIGILGCGFSGKAIAKKLSDKGLNVWGTTRKVENFSELEAAGCQPVLFDGMDLTDELLKALEDVTHLVISIAPPREENLDEPDLLVDPVLRAFHSKSIQQFAPGLKWVCYLSTVGVYGNHHGDWIDEAAELRPSSSRARQRVRAEKEWREFCETNSMLFNIFRLSGIYGAGRNALVSASAGKARRLIKKGQVFNRIHHGDIAQAVALGMEKKSSGVFNITDDEPAPPQDVVTFAHQLLDLTPPPEIDFETAELSPMARSFYGENKRVSNKKSKVELGMDYHWPDYRTSLKRMLDENCWR